MRRQNNLAVDMRSPGLAVAAFKYGYARRDSMCTERSESRFGIHRSKGVLRDYRSSKVHPNYPSSAMPPRRHGEGMFPSTLAKRPCRRERADLNASGLPAW
ncbi:hypothetical protein ABW21_db0208888 [Orbilia brochopaga]|nr:hypothetical protein ABW21_db0208888 [Drechslerella brochopaga]